MSTTLDDPLASLGRLTDDITDTFSDLPGSARQHLERRVTKLAPSHVRFVRSTLRDALADGHLSPVEYAHLGSFFERWWAHDAPAKLAVLERITSLAEATGRSGEPPVGFPLGPRLSESLSAARCKSNEHRANRLAMRRPGGPSSPSPHQSS